MLGSVEEEHAGGAVVYPSWSLGDGFQADSRRYNGRTIDDVIRDYGDAMDVYPEGYAVDRQFPDLIYIPENAKANLREQCIRWQRNGLEHSIPLRPGKVYMAPSGYKLRMEKHPAAPSWRLIGTAGEGTFCHKPCTVSGGGKSEISKSIADYMQYGPIFVADIKGDLDWVEEILQRDYSDRWTAAMVAKQNYQQFPSRPILSTQRSLGSVIKLMTPSEEYTKNYNAWLQSIPEHVYAILFIIKRFYQPSGVMTGGRISASTSSTAVRDTNSSCTTASLSAHTCVSDWKEATAGGPSRFDRISAPRPRFKPRTTSAFR